MLGTLLVVASLAVAPEVASAPGTTRAPVQATPQPRATSAASSRPPVQVPTQHPTSSRPKVQRPRAQPRAPRRAPPLLLTEHPHPAPALLDIDSRDPGEADPQLDAPSMDDSSGRDVFMLSDPRTERPTPELLPTEAAQPSSAEALAPTGATEAPVHFLPIGDS